MTSDVPSFEVPVELLKSALSDGASLTVRRNERKISRPLSVMSLGTLTLGSGRLIAGDVGMAFDMAKPFVRIVPPGEYQVFVSIWGLNGRGRTPPDGMGDTPRAAYLALMISNERPAKYEFASTGDNPVNWKPSEAYDGFGVDSGCVGIMDAEHLAVVRNLPESTDLGRAADRAIGRHPECKGTAGRAHLPIEPPVIVPMCESGWGDGSYFSYWGLDAADNPVVLIVDFDLDGKWTES